MKNLLTILFIFISVLASATNYYVSSAGNDANNGLSTSTSWKTIAKVNSTSFLPGDIIYFNKGNIWNETLTVPTSGNSGAPITFSSYGTGVNPLIDANNSLDRCITLTGRSYIIIDGIDCKNAISFGIASPSSPGTNITIKNLTISYIGTTNADLQDAIFQQGGYLTVDHCIITKISHCGIVFGGSHNTITNNNISYTNLYYTGWGAGINGTSSSDDISYNTIDNCGGVGQATKTHGIYVGLTNSQVHHNTITHSTKGSGIKAVAGGDFHHNYISGSYLSGIETGTNGSSTGATVNIYYNIFTGNRQAISESAQGTGAFTLNIYNNVCYYNNNTQEDNYYAEIALDENINTSLVIKNNILFGYGRFTYAFNTAQSHAVINNNCVYQSSGNLIYYNGSARTWSDWKGLGFDANGVNANPNLSNPPADFHLLSGSPAIGTGVSVGLTADYDGNTVHTPPSIGAFESGTSTPPTTAIPVFQNSSVANSNPSLLVLTYNLSLNNTIIPAVSSFTVVVNSTTVPISKVVISGTNVQLTLANPIVKGDVLTVAYTKPSVNPLQTASAGLAASLNAQTVANGVTGTIPAYVSSVVENATPSLLELTYNISLSTAIVPPASSYSIIVNGVARTVSTVSISTNKVKLNLASPIKYGDVITTMYTKPATNPLQTPDGGIAASFSVTSTTNNLAAGIKDASPVTISMTIAPNYIYKTIYIVLAYSSPLTTTQMTALTPQILRVADTYGRLCAEQVLATGVTSVRLPINLHSGIYNVLILANGAQMATKRIRVY
jgi:uncharacterized repeat protein (TIGR02059 family)